MKNVFALAAAALLATSAGALAVTTKTVTYPFNGKTCTATVTLSNNPTYGISRNVLAAIYENDTCGSLYGSGYVGKVMIAKGTTEDVATIGGITSMIPYPVTIALSQPFGPSGSTGQFVLTYTTDGKHVTFGAVGTYTVK